MDLTFRLPGPWGSGKGANLQPTEVDNNFWALAEAIVDLQSNPALPVGIASISVSGTQMTITLTDGTVMGPFTLPVLTFRWRGEWVPLAAYAELDVFTVLDTGIFMALLDHTSGATFDPAIAVGGEPALQQLFGSTNATLSGLSDVEITGGPNDGDVLIWQDPAWVNTALGSMAYQESDAVNITGGAITGMPTPASPSDVATKAYVDAMPGGATIDDYRMMANISGVVGPALPHTLSDFLDYALLTSARGTMLYRGGAGWVALAPGTSGYFLKTLGAGADPAWAVGGSGVTSVAAGAGITTGAGPITATGSVALASVADNSLLANITGTSAAPAAATLTAFLDHVASSTRGAILTRAGSGWVALAPGVSGYYLQTQGATADPVWSAPSGSGTVTSISAGTGISTGGAPITGAGTVSLAAIGTASVLANISGASAAPVPATVSVLFDSVFGSAQGAVVYRNASAWVMLPPGTSGQVLTTGGASANPAWANAAAGAPIANLLLLANISGSTAAPSGNTLSNIFDAILGSSRGMLVYRGATGWTTLSPGTTGQLLQTGGAAGNPSWVTGATGASISTSDTPPASPADGDAWWDSVGGQLYIRYDDGTSSQWVPASNQPGPQGPAGSANMSGMTAGQLPVAATATSVTSSIALPLAIANGGTGSTTGGAALAALGGAPLASPALTGNPTAPTPATADSDTSIATTAYVQAQGYATSAAMTTEDNLRVLKAGDVMTGALTVGGSLTVTGNTIQLNGVSALQSDGVGGGFTKVNNPSGGTAIWVGPTATYHDTGTHNFRDSGSGTTRVVFDAASTRNISGAWATISSASIKEDVQPYNRGLDAILELNPVQFRYQAGTPFAEPDRPSRVLYGLIADEVRPHVPEIVGSTIAEIKGESTEIDTLEPGNLIYALINAVKELSTKVAALEGKPA